MSGTGRPSGLQVHRLPEKQVRDPQALAQVLAAGIVAHVGVIHDGVPAVIPVGYCPWRDGVLIHGSTASRSLRSLASGAPTCLTVTLVDGLVAARSLYESSIEYRCAMLYGSFEPVAASDRSEAFQAISDHLLPGRWTHARHPAPNEDRATALLHLVPDDWSMKVGEGFATEPDEDLREYAHLWAGKVPLHQTPGEPVPDATAAGLPLPEYMSSWGRWGH